MASKKPLSQSDLAIGARIFEVRRMHRLSREDLAHRLRSRVDCDSGMIRRIEEGVAALKYGLAAAVIAEFAVDPKWLAKGVESVEGSKWIPSWSDLGIEPDSRFSEVFEAKLAPLFAKAEASQPAPGQGPHEWSQAFSNAYRRVTHWWVLSDMLYERFGRLAEAELDECFRKIADQVRALTKERRLEPVENQLQLRIVVDAIKLDFLRSGTQGAEKEVAGSLQSDKLPAVKFNWQRVRGKLNRLTEQPGAKSALAAYLGVPLSSLSLWLSGKREPGVEAGFRLLDWLQQQERKALVALQRSQGKHPTKG